MADYFLDSSALVKAYIAETGSAWLERILDDQQQRIFVSVLAEVEIIAALTRRFRVGDLTRRELDQAADEARQDRPRFLAVPVTNEIVATAVELAKRHNLRAYDAVQLATVMEVRNALLHNQAPPLDFTLLSADIELNAAAELEGVSVEDPNKH